MSDDSAREFYPRFYQQTTRWHDNDVYGHVNNVVYYSYFDSAANRYLIEECELDIHSGECVAFVVSSSCDYHQPIAYPSQLEVGLRVNKLGNKSVEYGLAIFAQGTDKAVAVGRFTHVFVNRLSGKAISIPSQYRDKLAQILTPSPSI